MLLRTILDFPSSTIHKCQFFGAKGQKQTPQKGFLATDLDWFEFE